MRLCAKQVELRICAFVRLRVCAFAYLRIAPKLLSFAPTIRIETVRLSAQLRKVNFKTLLSTLSPHNAHKIHINAEPLPVLPTQRPISLSPLSRLLHHPRVLHPHVPLLERHELRLPVEDPVAIRYRVALVYND